MRVTPYLSWNAVPGPPITRPRSRREPSSPRRCSIRVGDPDGYRTWRIGVLPDGNYVWRVRAFDAASNPGPWTVESSYTKSWVAPTPTAPADGATVDSFGLGGTRSRPRRPMTSR